MKHDLKKIVKETVKNMMKEMDAVGFKEKNGISMDLVPRKVGQSTSAGYVVKEQEDEKETQVAKSVDDSLDKLKFTSQQQQIIRTAIKDQPTRYRAVLLNLAQQIDDLTKGEEGGNQQVKQALAVLGRGIKESRKNG
tara:strand:- start:124 stop:534 length:411 start_codon:yes stop_codon:yes gene_type:complete